MFVVVVTGTRKAKQQHAALIADVLADVFDDAHSPALWHGKARGVDTLAGAWAFDQGIAVRPVPAEWTTHAAGWCRCPTPGRYCRMAGPRRNQAMLDLADPDIVVAFPGQVSPGTWDMMRRARAAGIPLREHPLDI